MCLLQLVRALGHKHIGRLHIGLDRVHHRALFVHQRAQFLVYLVHAHDVVLQLADVALLLLHRLQVNVLLQLRLLLALLRHAHADEVVLERTIAVAVVVAVVATPGIATRGPSNGLAAAVAMGMRPRLFEGVPLVVHCLPLDRLEGRQCGREFVHESVPLYLEVAVLAVANLVDHVLRVIDQLLRVRSDLVAGRG